MIAVVTGGTRGIGYELAGHLAVRGYKVILIGRDARQGTEAAAMVARRGPGAQFLAADLSLVSEADRVATVIKSMASRIDLLVHSAGLLVGHRALTAEGIELNFAVNYLARFALTEQLAPELYDSSTILIISGGARGRPIMYEDVNLTRRFSVSRVVRQYCRANDLLALGVHRRSMPELGTVRVGCVKFGIVRTEIRREFPWWMKLGVPLLDPFLSQSAAEAADAAMMVLDTIRSRPDAGPLYSKVRSLTPFTLSPENGSAERSSELIAFSRSLLTKIRTASASHESTTMVNS